MIELLPQSTGNVVGFKISGKLSAHDYALMMPKIDELIDKYEEIHLLMLVEYFEGAGLDAIKPDFNFGTNQYRQVRKAAFVTEKRWMKRLVKMLDPFTRRTEERIFDLDHFDEAWQWLLGMGAN